MNTKEDKIKFLVFSAAYPYRGGISDSTHSLCNEMTKSGVKTEVGTFPLLYPSFLFPGKSQFSNEVYDQNFKIAKNHLKESHPNLIIPDAGFYLWLPVEDDLKTTTSLWKNFSIRVMPGSFMAEEVSGENPCKGYLRVALVHKKEIVNEAMERISNYFRKNN